MRMMEAMQSCKYSPLLWATTITLVWWAGEGPEVAGAVSRFGSGLHDRLLASMLAPRGDRP